MDAAEATLPGHRPRPHARPRPVRDAQARGRRARLLRGARRPPAVRGLDELGLERPSHARDGRADLPALRGQRGARRRLPPAGHGRAAGRHARPAHPDRPARLPARPLHVITYRGVRVRAQLKAMTVMQSYLAQRAATAAGADDAILVDDEGRIFEGATSNMFLVRGGGLVTPPAEGAILPGVLRAKVEELADRRRHPRGRGVRARRRPAPRRRHAAHQQRARHRAGGRVDGRELLVDEQVLAGAARACRRSRGGERRRLPRRLPLRPRRAPPPAPAAPGYVHGAARNHEAHARSRRPRHRAPLAVRRASSSSAAGVYPRASVAGHGCRVDRRPRLRRRRERRAGRHAAATRSRAAAGRRASRSIPGRFDQPVYVAAPPGDTSRLFVVEKTGRIRIVKDGAAAATPVPRHLARMVSERRRAGPAVAGLPPALRQPTGASTSTTPTAPATPGW